ncbi:MAG TPA: hypothetical protein VFR35_16695 [Actinoplanes sp.]|nr:hypothetical protein [Actinoplanes sp.]
MNLLKSPLRRTTAALAGAFIGLAGAVAVASPAMATHPTVTGTATCVGEDGWTVDWEVTNGFDVDGVITAVEVAAPEGGTLTGNIKAETELPAGETVAGALVVPADVAEARIKVAVDFDNGHSAGLDEGVGTVARPAEECEPEQPPGEEPPGEEPGEEPPGEEPGTPEIPEMPGSEPTPIFDVTCDTMTLGLANPEDGIEITLHFETSNDEQRTLVIAPGEKKAETFSAAPGFKLFVTFSAEGEQSEPFEIPYQQPEGCEGTGGGSELPLTGAAAGGIAGGAALLLAIGGVLFVLARRRKVKFTA